jgi:hypothetical protein
VVPVIASLPRTPVRSGGTRHGGTRDPAEPIGDVFIAGARRGGGRVGRLHLGVDLRAVHLDAARSLDPEPDGVAAHVENDHSHVVPDHDAFPGTAS